MGSVRLRHRRAAGARGGAPRLRRQPDPQPRGGPRRRGRPRAGGGLFLRQLEAAAVPAAGADADRARRRTHARQPRPRHARRAPLAHRARAVDRGAARAQSGCGLSPFRRARQPRARARDRAPGGSRDDRGDRRRRAGQWPVLLRRARFPLAALGRSPVPALRAAAEDRGCAARHPARATAAPRALRRPHRRRDAPALRTLRTRLRRAGELRAAGGIRLRADRRPLGVERRQHLGDAAELDARAAGGAAALDLDLVETLPAGEIDRAEAA